MGDQRILILGASGQVGNALCRQLGSAALPAARTPPSADWLRLDLEEIAADPHSLNEFLDQHKLSAIVCTAGATDVERCERDPAWAEAANHTGPAALARAAAARELPFVFYSTDYVFPGTSENPGPYAEDAPTHPLSVYGRSKLAGERAILATHPRALILRTTGVYGPDPQGKNFLYTLHRLLSSGQTMRVPADQISTPTYNEDLARATLALLHANACGIFNVAGPELLSRYDFALLAARILNLNASLLQPVTTAELHQQAARPLLSGLPIEKLLQTLPGFHPHENASAIRFWAGSL